MRYSSHVRVYNHERQHPLSFMKWPNRGEILVPGDHRHVRYWTVVVSD